MLAGGAAALGLGFQVQAKALPQPLSGQVAAPMRPPAARALGRELVVVDARVGDLAELIRAARPSAELLVIDATGDGVAQIREALEGRRDVAAVHLFAHGAPGRIRLGREELSARTVARRGEELGAWFSSVAPFERRPDLFIYGCNAGAGKEGARFVAALAAATGADVAASDDVTGSPALGGDYALEVTSGAVEGDLALTESVLSGYPGTLEEDVLVVTNTADEGDGSLRQAILKANDDDDPSTILFAFEGECSAGSALADAGLCPADGGLTQAVADGGELLPAEIVLTGGELHISTPVSIEGPGADRLVIDANSESRVFNVVDAGDVSIRGLTLQNGKEFRLVSEDGWGGGTMHVSNTVISVSDCVVRNGVASVGGGFAFGGTAMDVTITDTVFTGNTSSFGGGALYFSGGGAATIVRATITGNQAGGDGGGLKVRKTTVEIHDSTFEGNTAGDEGGALVADYASVEVHDSTFEGNTAGYGGGALVADDASVEVDGSTFEGNTAGYEGGALFAGYDASVEVHGSTFEGNMAEKDGGAMCVDWSSSIELVNTTVSGNVSTSGGGGIVVRHRSLLALYSATVTNNSGATAGGVWANTDTIVVSISSIVQGNRIATSDAGVMESDVQIDDGAKFFAGASLFGKVDGTVNMLSTSLMIDADAMLEPLANKGGPTRTHALPEGSPALDSGWNIQGLPYDQRGVGFDRVSGDGPDIGAFELQVAWSAEPDAGGSGTDGGVGSGTDGGVGSGTDGGVGSASSDGCGCTVVGAQPAEAAKGLSALWLGLVSAIGLRRRGRRS